MSTNAMSLNQSKCQGFTYIGILLTVALIGTTLSVVGTSWSAQSRRANEADLLYVGQTFRRAIASYHNATPNGVHQYPRSLTDLISDNRGVKFVRHLREIYRDPMTGAADWELISLPDGAIIGVASHAPGRPLKRSNFGAWEAAFENADCFCDWKFVYLPQLIGDSTVTP
jgi:type II secretory pathway pseudopilin PulG